MCSRENAAKYITYFIHVTGAHYGTSGSCSEYAYYSTSRLCSQQAHYEYIWVLKGIIVQNTIKISYSI